MWENEKDEEQMSDTAESVQKCGRSKLWLNAEAIKNKNNWNAPMRQ